MRSFALFLFKASLAMSKKFQRFFQLARNVGVRNPLQIYAPPPLVFVTPSKALGTRQTRLAETLFEAENINFKGSY